MEMKQIAWVAILIFDKINVKMMAIRRDKEGNFIIQQEIITRETKMAA